MIGQGGMAEVYRGRDERLARPVALKVLLSSFAGDSELRARFEEEAKAAAMVSHPNIVAVYDAGEDEGRAFIVMELVPGETLAALVGRQPMDVGLVRRLGAGILDALAAAHASGLLHRDIKPANVLLGPDDTARVADFGIAKAAQASAADDRTIVNAVLGTPMYLAPERARGSPATVRSDLWSVGVVLYEMLTGRRPFAAESAIASSLAAAEGRYTPLGELRPDAGTGLAAVIDRALRPDPGERFASAAEMAAALRSSGTDTTARLAPMAQSPAGAETEVLPLGASPPTTVARAGAAGGTLATTVVGQDGEWPPRRPRSNGPLLLTLVVVVAIAAAVIGIALATSSPGPPRPGHRTTTTTRPRSTTSSSPSTSSTTTSSTSSTTSSTSSTTTSS
ncbi:MAG: serine/threonine-protein kinase, partial [Acidimicrobiales bacterium]